MDFAFYSTDIDPTTDPANADPAPDTLVVLEDLPTDDGDSYDLHGGEVGRGTVFQTLGGAVVQDFGVFLEDLHLSFSKEKAPVSAATISQLKAIHEIIDGEYYFTDGYDVWLVRFLRPGGFRYRRNLYWAYQGQSAYSYEIELIVSAHLKRADCGFNLECVAGS